MPEPSVEPSDAPGEMIASWRVALALLLGFVAYRAWFVLGLPGIAGSDPYTRLYARDQVVVELFGRKWPPLLQLCVKTIYELGGDIGHVRIFMTALGAAFLLAALAYARRGFGRAEALLVALWLAAEPDILWITLAPYQELLLYTPMCLALLVLARASALAERLGARAPGDARALGLCALALTPCLALAETARYEGALLVLAVGVALAEPLVRQLGLRRALPYLALLGVLVALPIADYLAYTGGVGVAQRSPSEALRPGSSLTNLDHLGHYLLRESTLLWPALAGLVLTIRSGVARRLDLRALHLYALLFVATYVLTTPYIPASNRRFHVPLLLWLTIHAAIGVVGVARWLLAGASPRARQVGLAAITAFVATQVGYTWRRAERFAERRTQEHARETTIGRAVDARVARDRVIVMAWARGDYHGYPSMRNMRVIAQLGGDVARVRFLDDYDAADEAAREGLLRTAGGLLMREKAGGSAAAMVERATQLRGAPTRTRVAKDVVLLTW